MGIRSLRDVLTAASIHTASGVTLNNHLKVVSASRSSRTGRGTWGDSLVSVMNKSKNLNAFINTLRSCLIPLLTIATSLPTAPHLSLARCPLSASPVRQLWQHQDEIRMGLASDRPEPGFRPSICSSETGMWKGLATQGQAEHAAPTLLTSICPEQPSDWESPSCVVSFTHRSHQGWSGVCRSSAPHISYRRYAAPCEC